MVRGRGIRTSAQDDHADRAPDLLERDFTAGAPNRRWVADFTYVRTWGGFVYVTFVIDCFSRTIVGWHAATTKQTPLVTIALRAGLWRRDRAGQAIEAGLVHHSDAGSQYTSIHFAETLALEGIAASIGSIGDAYDCQSVSARTMMVSFFSLLQKNVLDRRSGTTRDELRVAIVTWIERTYHRRRGQSRLGRLIPIKFEAIMNTPAALAA